MTILHHRSTLTSRLGLFAVACLVLGLNSCGNRSATLPSNPPTTVAPAPIDVSTIAPAPIATTTVPELVVKKCVLTAKTLSSTSRGKDVICLQKALIAAGFLTSKATGFYGPATFSAIQKLQESRELFVDGKVGRETALSLDVWPAEVSLVVRTLPPAPNAVDLMGFALSSVATSGPDAPSLPARSGKGRRVVYSRAGQRVWAVNAKNVTVRSWLVSGSRYENELPGTYKVYSRSEKATAVNGKSYFSKMVRWLRTKNNAIGFHSLPLHTTDDSAYQTEQQLGLRLSDGCQRQANLDADFMWEFAVTGTPVIVL